MWHHKVMPYRRLSTLMLAAVMLIALISACGKKESGAVGAYEGTVIATYKGGELTDTEYDKYAAFSGLMSPEKAMYMGIPQLKQQFVTQYIVTKELAKDVSEDAKKEADKQAATFRTELETQMKAQAELKAHMDDNKLTVDEAVAFFKNDSLFQSLYATKGEELKPNVKDEDIKAEFDKAPKEFNVVSVRHVLVGTIDPQTQAQLNSDEDALKLAQEVKAKLDAGGDWNALAKEYSTDTGSKDKGGLYEKQSAYKWVAEFKEAANNQEIGAVGDPVRSEFGYHVMKVESRDATAYDKLTAEDKEFLKSAVATTQIGEFLTAEQDKLEIKVTLPEEPAATAPSSPAASPEASPAASPAAK